MKLGLKAKDIFNKVADHPLGSLAVTAGAVLVTAAAIATSGDSSNAANLEIPSKFVLDGVQHACECSEIGSIVTNQGQFATNSSEAHCFDKVVNRIMRS